MLNSAAAWSLESNTNEVLRWIGTARAPVAGSGAAPAWTAKVSNPGSLWPGIEGLRGCCGGALWALLGGRQRGALSGRLDHEGERHPARQGRHAVHGFARSAAGRRGQD